jgi:DnaD/phage-associated family protein
VVERPNIFVLYEQNIGLIQPLIAEELREAEKTYPAAWIEEAFKIAVERNARNWRYIQRILERWAAEGKDDGRDRRRSEKDRRRYIEGEFADYIEH